MFYFLPNSVRTIGIVLYTCKHHKEHRNSSQNHEGTHQVIYTVGYKNVLFWIVKRQVVIFQQTVRLEEKQNDFHEQNLPLATWEHTSLSRKMTFIFFVFDHNLTVNDGHDGKNNAATKSNGQQMSIVDVIWVQLTTVILERILKLGVEILKLT